MSEKIIVANWKMQKSFLQAVNWIKTYKNEITSLAEKTNRTIVICPSFDSLSSIKKELENSNILLGAQNCAPVLIGSYTGQVSALSLKEIGCDYCIVGHSEDRKYNFTDNEQIGLKAKILIDNKIIPIICIGESLQENKNNKTQEVLLNQISIILSRLTLNSDHKIIIAYEPIWAIGTGLTPKSQDIEDACEIVKKFIRDKYPDLDFKILYGGSVNEENITNFKNIDNIDGFLLGNSSLDFQVLKKIVSLY